MLRLTQTVIWPSVFCKALNIDINLFCLLSAETGLSVSSCSNLLLLAFSTNFSLFTIFSNILSAARFSVLGLCGRMCQIMSNISNFQRVRKQNVHA